MSRSYKKHPYWNIYGVKSQKEDKRLGNRRLRRINHQLTYKWAEVDPDLVYPVMDEILNVWSMPKDGTNAYWPFEENNIWWDDTKRNGYGSKLTAKKVWFLRVMRK